MGKNSSCADLSAIVSQESIFLFLTFVIYINDLQTGYFQMASDLLMLLFAEISETSRRNKKTV